VPSKLKSFKRRAAGVHEQDVTHRENLRLLFAPGAVFKAVLFETCDLNLATLTNAVFDECTFRSCRLVGASFRAAQLDHCTFLDCEMPGVSFEGARMRAVGFDSCEMEGASFLGAVLQAPVSILKCGLMNADLRFYECDNGQPAFAKSDLRGVSFSVNCEFWNATFDEKATSDFGRVFARASKDDDLIRMVKARWGADAYEAVDGYMRRDD
jgi:uncharacterized protein YjbI with pentapeptide repeats